MLVVLLLAATTPELVDLSTLDARFVLDIKYATADNFTGKVLYPKARCLLRPEVASMTVKAQAWLDTHAPGHVLMLKDCYRPESVQRLMWDVVKDTPMKKYVSPPNSKTGAVHTYGAAVDLTLMKDGKEVDMGTPYDHLDVLAEPRHEEEFVTQGKLTRAQVAARHVLRDAMVQGGGFRPISNEWWHFDALRGDALRSKYQKLDVPL